MAHYRTLEQRALGKGITLDAAIAFAERHFRLEVKRLLAAALRYQDGVAAAAIAICLFAGLRPSELADLKKEDVTAARIRISGGKLRRTLKRSAPIPLVLAKWLERHPFEGIPAGWHHKLKVLKRVTRAKKWVQDVIRHTSITFQAERDKDERLTAFNCGTSKAMMDRHYCNSVDHPAEVDEFWSLTPEAILSDDQIEISLPATAKIDWPSRAELKRMMWPSPMMHAAASWVLGQRTTERGSAPVRITGGMAKDSVRTRPST